MALRELVASRNGTKGNEADVDQAAYACLKHSGIIANDKVGARGKSETDERVVDSELHLRRCREKERGERDT